MEYAFVNPSYSARTLTPYRRSPDPPSNLSARHLEYPAVYTLDEEWVHQTSVSIRLSTQRKLPQQDLVNTISSAHYSSLYDGKYLRTRPFRLDTILLPSHHISRSDSLQIKKRTRSFSHDERPAMTEGSKAWNRKERLYLIDRPPMSGKGDYKTDRVKAVVGGAAAGAIFWNAFNKDSRQSRTSVTWHGRDHEERLNNEKKRGISVARRKTLPERRGRSTCRREALDYREGSYDFGREKPGIVRKQVRVVSPPGNEKKPTKGILRTPTLKFPEDPNPSTEVGASLKNLKREDVPQNARWTKINRKLVNAEALEASNERFEALGKDFIIVFRVLTRDEIQRYAEVTENIRATRQRYKRHSK